MDESNKIKDVMKEKLRVLFINKVQDKQTLSEKGNYATIMEFLK